MWLQKTFTVCNYYVQLFVYEVVAWFPWGRLAHYQISRHLKQCLPQPVLDKYWVNEQMSGLNRDYQPLVFVKWAQLLFNSPYFTEKNKWQGRNSNFLYPPSHAQISVYTPRAYDLPDSLRRRDACSCPDQVAHPDSALPPWPSSLGSAPPTTSSFLYLPHPPQSGEVHFGVNGHGPQQFSQRICCGNVIKLRQDKGWMLWTRGKNRKISIGRIQIWARFGVERRLTLRYDFPT